MLCFLCYYDVKRVVKYCFRLSLSIMPLIFVHTYTQMHIKNVFWLTSLDVYFSLNVSTNMSNLPLDPSFFFFSPQLHLSLNLLNILIYQSWQLPSKRKLASSAALLFRYLPACSVKFFKFSIS